MNSDKRLQATLAGGDKRHHIVSVDVATTPRLTSSVTSEIKIFGLYLKVEHLVALRFILICFCINIYI